MKKKRLIILAGLFLLLSSCHEKYDHTSVAIDGIGSYMLFFFVLSMAFIIPLFAIGIPFLISGLKHIKKAPRKAKPIAGVSIGGTFLTFGIILTVIVSNSFFNPEFTIPEARNYRTLEKVLAKATDEDYCSYRISTGNYGRDEYLPDYNLSIKEALTGVEYRSLATKPNFGSTNLRYYVDITHSANGTYPFCEICVYNNGAFYIDYVRGYDHDTVTYFFQMDAKKANEIVELGKSMHQSYRDAEEAATRRVHEAGKIEHFFNTAKQKNSVAAEVVDDRSIPHYFSFSKEGFNVISDFYYTETSSSHTGTSLFVLNRGFVDSGLNWVFTLYKIQSNEYFVRLEYHYDGTKRDYDFTYYYSVRNSDAESIIEIALEQAKAEEENRYSSITSQE